MCIVIFTAYKARNYSGSSGCHILIPTSSTVSNSHSTIQLSSSTVSNSVIDIMTKRTKNTRTKQTRTKRTKTKRTRRSRRTKRIRRTRRTRRSRRSRRCRTTRNPTGFLDLPPELRLLIYRYLLIRFESIQFGVWGTRLPVAILSTSRLIHRETFDVLYRENEFANTRCNISCWPITRFRRIVDTIKDIVYEQRDDVVAEEFLELMHYFGNPSTIRGTLTVIFSHDPQHPLPLKWFVRALGRFTNFQTVELWDYLIQFRRRKITELDHFEAALKPVLGIGSCTGYMKKYLRFHPIDHRNRCRELDNGHGDWANSLDGIRLTWNDEVTNAQGSEDVKAELEGGSLFGN